MRLPLNIHEMNYQCRTVFQTLEDHKTPLLPSVRLQIILKMQQFYNRKYAVHLQFIISEKKF